MPCARLLERTVLSSGSALSLPHHRAVCGRNDIPQEVARDKAEYDDGARDQIRTDFGELQYRQGEEHEWPDQKPRAVFAAEPESDFLQYDTSCQRADDVSQAGDHENIADDPQRKSGIIGKKCREEVQLHAGQHDEKHIGDPVGVEQRPAQSFGHLWTPFRQHCCAITPEPVKSIK